MANEASAGGGAGYTPGNTNTANQGRSTNPNGPRAAEQQLRNVSGASTGTVTPPAAEEPKTDPKRPADTTRNYDKSTYVPSTKETGT